MDEMQTASKSPDEPAALQERVREFTLPERAAAFAAVILGFAFIKLAAAPLLTQGRMGLGAAAFLLAALLFCGFFPARVKKRTAGNAVRLVLCILFSVNIFISSNTLIQFLDFVFVLPVIAYDKLASSDERFLRIRKMFPADLFSAVMVLPFYDYGACHAAIRASAARTRAGNGVKNALIGLALAVPSTAAVLILLMSADERFAGIILSMSDDSLRKIVILIVQLILGLPVGYYIYGLCRSSEKGFSSEVINDERCLDTVRSVRLLPYAAGVFSAVPICVLYVIFFFTQLPVYLSAFTHTLPPEMGSFAEYARRGFFELCFVSVINLAVIISINLFCKYKEDGTRPLPLRIMTCVLSGFTLILIATAVSKMAMYIDVYGLTLLRLYTTWFMLLLALIFIGLIIAFVRPQINLPRFISTVFTAMLAILSFADVDGLIAGYNADRFINGTLSEFDVSLMRELSEGAIPDAVRVMPYIESEYDRERLADIISEKLSCADEGGIRTITVSTIAAEKAAAALTE